MKPGFFSHENINILYIHPDTKKCKACWKCIEECSGQVIGKVEILWHKHARINKGDQCFGCLTCVEGCDSGAIMKRER
jgi:uncharacterized Fe-S center protein